MTMLGGGSATGTSEMAPQQRGPFENVAPAAPPASPNVETESDDLPF